MDNFLLDQTTALRATSQAHAHLLLEAVNNNRCHLSQFMPWVQDMQTLENFTTYLERCEQLRDRGLEFAYDIFHLNRFSGRIGLHNIDYSNRHASIGYWLNVESQGKGIIIRACQVMLHYAFTALSINRIEIMVATDNIRSRKIPQKLGFTQEGILRQYEKHGDQYLDLVLYSLLQSEWQNQTHCVLDT